MSNDRPFQSPGSDESLQEKFDRLAPEMGLELEKPTVAQRCSVGIAVIRIMPKTILSQVQMATTAAPRPAREADGATIADVIQKFECAHPNDLPGAWRDLVIEPFIAVGTQHDAVDEKLLPLPTSESMAMIHPILLSEVDEAIKSEAFAKQKEIYPPASDQKREVAITNLQTTFIGADMAVTTYHFVETYKTGELFEGNSGVILLRGKDTGWRIAVYTKHNRGRDMTRVSTESTEKI